MSCLLLRPQDLKGLLTMKEAIDLVEESYRGITEFPVINAPRRRVHSPSGVRISNFPGGVPRLGVIGAGIRADMVAQQEGFQTIPYREHPVMCSMIQRPGNCWRSCSGRSTTATSDTPASWLSGRRRPVVSDSVIYRAGTRKPSGCSAQPDKRPISCSLSNASDRLRT